MLLTNYIERDAEGAVLNLARNIHGDAADFKRSFSTMGCSAKECHRVFSMGVQQLIDQNIHKIRLPYFEESSFFVDLLERTPGDKHYTVELVIPSNIEVAEVPRALFDAFHALPRVTCSIFQEQIHCVSIDEAELARGFSLQG